MSWNLRHNSTGTMQNVFMAHTERFIARLLIKPNCSLANYYLVSHICFPIKVVSFGIRFFLETKFLSISKYHKDILHDKILSKIMLHIFTIIPRSLLWYNTVIYQHFRTKLPLCPLFISDVWCLHFSLKCSNKIYYIYENQK